MKTLFLVSLAATVATLSALGAELPGYPHDVLAKRAGYACIEQRDDALKTVLGADKASVLVYSICSDKRFDDNATNLARKAVVALQKAVLLPEVHRCLLATKTFPGDGAAYKDHKAFLRTVVLPAFSPKEIVEGFYDEAQVFVSALDRKDETANLLAEGYAELFNNPAYSTTRSTWKRHLSFAFAAERIGARGFAFGDDVAFWSAMAGVAFLKNMGLLTTTGDGADARVSAVASCFRWSGKVPALHAGIGGSL